MTVKVFGCATSSSSNNAAIPGASAHLVRVTQPFHPLNGQRLQYAGARYNRYGKRLLLRAEDATVWSVPPQWTDTVAPDPEVVMGRGRSFFRVVDLLELASLVEHLAGERRGKRLRMT
jgi:hypothetical protein